MNIQRGFNTYFDINQGNLALQLNKYYDQSHFIKEIKKHTGVSPKELFKNKNKTFKQVRNINK